MKKLLPTLVLFICSLTAFSQQPTDKLLEFYNILRFSYVDSFDFDALSEQAIITMLAELDPHSMYIPSEKVKQMNESLKGEYEGIGIQFDLYHDTVLVVTVIPGGPSALSGIRSGDRIIKADEKVISGASMSDADIINILRGKHGTLVNLTVKRRGIANNQVFPIKRDKIPINSVDVSYMIDDHTGYIKINRFSKNTMDEFKTAMKDISNQGGDRLIIDLRDNGGGYLMSAVDLADEFLDGRTEIVRTKGLRQSEQVFKSSSKGSFQQGKLVVLVNEGSASASEIFAGAIQDRDRGVILGRRTYGKGLVMKPYTLSDGSVIRLTTSKYYTPSGRCIQKEYGDSKDTYDHEITERFEKGEMFHLDSANFPKELLFKTEHGRNVYGGGGILPDVFVAADSVLLSEPLQKIFKTTAFVDFSMQFSEDNRTLLSNYSNENELWRDQDISLQLTEGFLYYLKNESIISEDLGPEYNLPLKRQLMAFIGRYVWDDYAYHRIMNKEQLIIDEALRVLNDNEFNWDELSFK
ncbi:MAG: S41 family peptidase [Vicingaceae bacterium]